MYIPTINVQLYSPHMTPEKWETVESIIDKIIYKWATRKSKKVSDSDVERLRDTIQPFLNELSENPGQLKPLVPVSKAYLMVI